MAATAVLKRATGKAHPTQFDEGVDDAVLDSLITSTVTTADLYNDANTVTVNLGGSALVTANLATGASVTTVNLGTGTSVSTITIGANTGAGDVIDIGGTGSITTIKGDLVVDGTKTTLNTADMNVQDNHVYLNADYTTAVAQTGGLVVNYLPTAVATTVATTGFVAGVAATSNPTVEVASTAGFAVGDLVQVSGATNQGNDGLYEVLALLTIPTRLQIRGIGITATVEDFTQNQFIASASAVGAVTKVTASILRSGTDGIWETAAGSTTGLTFTDLATSAGTTLQVAYDNDVDGAGATITTNATDGNVIFAGDQALQVTATGGLDVDTLIDFDGTTADFLATGLLSLVSSQAAVTAVTITASNVAGGVDINAGTGGIAVDTTGGVAIEAATASSVNVTTGALTLSTTTSGNLTLSTTTAGDVIVTSAGAVTIDGVAVSIDATADSNLTATNTSASTNITQTISAANTGAVAGNSTLALNATSTNGTGAIDLNADDTVTVDVLAAGTISVSADAVAATVNVATGAGAKTATIGSTNTTSTLTLQAGTGAMTVTAGGILDINATGAVTVDTPAGISLDASTASNLTVSGAAADLTLGARAATITLNEAGNTALDGTFTATSLVGALNELKTAGVAEADQVVLDIATTGLTVGAPVYISAANVASHTDASAEATARFVGIVKTIGILGVGEVVAMGQVPMSFAAGLTVVAGDELYLSETAARVTNVAPTTNNSMVAVVGYAKNTTGLSATTVDGETAACFVFHGPRFEN